MSCPKKLRLKKKVDKSYPLLIRSYNISKYSTPTDITTEHVRQQLNHYINEEYGPGDSSLIKNMYIKLGPPLEVTFVLKNKREETRRIDNVEYMINKSSLIAELASIMETAKEDVQFKTVKNPIYDQKISPAERYRMEAERKLQQGEQPSVMQLSNNSGEKPTNAGPQQVTPDQSAAQISDLQQLLAKPGQVSNKNLNSSSNNKKTSDLYKQFQNK